MLRFEEYRGWWLVTHPEHAHLAGEFANRWGNDQFASPEPREQVLRGIYSHDDGRRSRDAEPVITRQGKTAAFSSELVGKYSAFEEIDLTAYLAVRREAVQLMATVDPYAAILISMHTHNLLSERADRSTIRANELQWLDAFLEEQMTLQRALREQLIAERWMALEYLTPESLLKHFQLLQACDNLSLLSCVDFDGDATLLHPFAMKDGGATAIKVKRVGERAFRLTPYPFAESDLSFTFSARHVPRKTFASSEELRGRLNSAQAVDFFVSVSA
jgi:hypothetical protein